MSATRVLCPLDGSSQAERALTSSRQVSELLDLPLVLFSAVEDRHLVGAQTEYLQALDVDNAKLEVVVDPHPPRAIVEGAAGDSLVVMATSTQPLMHHGYLGSAAETVIRDSSLATMLIGPRASPELVSLERTVVCCDGSSLSEMAIEIADVWSKLLGNELWVISVLPPDYSHGSAAPEDGYVRALARRVNAQWDVLHGSDPARSIAAWADDALIVMTSHGRAGWSRLRMGSVTAATTRWAAGPVLVRGPHG